MAEINRLVPRLQYNVKRRHRTLKNPEGPLGRINKIRAVLSALFKYERIELNQPKCDETRGYAERLISEAVRHGDKHLPTMQLADFWLEDKQLIHKLFKVLVPRYANFKTTYTTQHLVPLNFELARSTFYFQQNCVLELKGNPYPPMPQKPKPNSASLTNILLKEASKEFRKMKLNSEAAKEKSTKDDAQ